MHYNLYLLKIFLNYTLTLLQGYLYTLLNRYEKLGVFQNPDELEERMGQITPEFNAKHAQIHSKCSDVKRNVLIVNEMPEGAPDNPKFIARRTFIAKRGKRDSLLEYLNL